MALATSAHPGCDLRIFLKYFSAVPNTGKCL